MTEKEKQFKEHIVASLQEKLHLSSDSDISGIFDEYFSQKNIYFDDEERITTIRQKEEGYYWYKDATSEEWIPAQLIRHEDYDTIFCLGATVEYQVDEHTQLGPRILPPII